MDREAVMREIERAAKIVEAWPEWKQNLLEQSGKPMMQTAREFVDNRR